MDRATRTMILSLIYLALTLALFGCAVVAMWRDQPDISLIALLGMVAMAIVTDNINNRCRNLVERGSKSKRAGEQV